MQGEWFLFDEECLNLLNEVQRELFQFEVNFEDIPKLTFKQLMNSVWSDDVGV